MFIHYPVFVNLILLWFVAPHFLRSYLFIIFFSSSLSKSSSLSTLKNNRGGGVGIFRRGGGEHSSPRKRNSLKSGNIAELRKENDNDSIKDESNSNNSNNSNSNSNDKDYEKNGIHKKSILYLNNPNDDDDDDDDDNENNDINNNEIDNNYGNKNEKKSVSLFSNLFHNHSKLSPDSRNKQNKAKNSNKYTENDNSKDNDNSESSPNMKRKYTQFGYFSRRPSCIADSDFITIVISGLEVNNLFYVDRLCSPKPYLELSIGQKRGELLLNLFFLTFSLHFFSSV